MWKCALCLVVLTLTLKAMIMHIRMTHASTSNFNVVCGIENCSKKYNKFDSFYRHIKRTHGHLYEATVYEEVR